MFFQRNGSMRRVQDDDVLSRAISPTDRFREKRRQQNNLLQQNNRSTSGQSSAVHLRANPAPPQNRHVLAAYDQGSPAYDDNIGDIPDSPQYNERDDVVVLSDDDAPEPPRRPSGPRQRGTLRAEERERQIEPEYRRRGHANNARQNNVSSGSREQETRRGNLPPNGTANTNGIAPRSNPEVVEVRDNRPQEPLRAPQLPNRTSNSLHPQNNYSYQAPPQFYQASPQLYQAPPQQQVYTVANTYRNPADVLRINQLEEDKFLLCRYIDILHQQHHPGDIQALKSMDEKNKELSTANTALERKVEQSEARLERLQETLRRGLDEHYDSRWEHTSRRSHGGQYSPRSQGRDEGFHGPTASNSYRERSRSPDSFSHRRYNDNNAERNQGRYEHGQGASSSRDHRRSAKY